MNKKLLIPTSVWIAMKVSVQQILLCVFLCGLSYARTSFGQEILTRPVSLEMENTKLRKVLSAIEDQTKVRFVYSSSAIDINQKVNIRATEKNLDLILKEIFRPMSVSYVVSDDRILLKKEKKEVKMPSGEIPQPAEIPHAADRTVTGVVKDEAGLTLPGVSILVKGKQLGTTTGANGSYTLEIGEDSDTLVFSFVGYLSQDVFVGTQSTVDVTLKPNDKALEEVVVVGYGTQKAVNLTGAVSQISAQELQDRPVNRMTQALQGVIPNLNVTFGSGKPGQSGTLNIRGNTSINGGAPLVLIDGVPGDIDRVNVFDVETVTVLKDASASAVYGARAAFGVILVTTKNAKKGKTTITYSNSLATTTHARSTDYMTSGYWNAKINDDAMYAALGSTNTRYTTDDYDELLARVNDKTENPARPWVVVKPNANGQDMYRYYANFDWFNYLFQKNRPKSEHNLSVSGATDKVRYLISGTRAAEEGIWKIRPDDYVRTNFRAKLDADVTKWFRLNSNTRYFKSNYSWFGLEDNFPAVSNDVTPNHLYHFMPAYVPKNPDGTLTGYTGINSYSVGYGMHAIMENGKSRGENNISEFATTLEGTITITPELKITGNYTFQQDNRADYYRAVRVQYSKFPGVLENFALARLNTDQLKETFQNNRYQVINVFGNYDKTFGAHTLKAMAGFNQEERIFKTYGGTGSELLSETLNDLNFVTGENIVTGGASEWALRGAFYRLNYIYKDKYLFETSGRYDGTSRFAKSDRFGFFPSFSAGWRISEESFFSPLKSVVENLKVRYSFGTLGNQDVATYAYISSMTTGKINYLVGGNKLNVVNNPAPVASSLTWEKTATNNIGLDADFLSNRLNLVVDLYSRSTKDMLTLGKTLPTVFGAAEPRQNAADLTTKGFEVSLGWRDKFSLGGSTFSYNLRGVLADYTSKITRFDNPTNLLSNYYVGQQLGEIWGYKYDGYFKTTDEAQAYAKVVNQDNINKRRVQAPTAELKMLQAGDIKILDLDNSGTIDVGANTLANPGDRRVIGNTQPRYTYGLTASASWKGIDFSAFFQGVGKQNWYPNLEAQQFWHVYARPYGSFLPSDFQNMIWSPENPNAYFPKVRGYIAQNSELSVANDMYLQNTAYCKLKNLTIGYTVPNTLTKKIKIDRVRLFASGENLITWTKLESKYIDPEETMIDQTARTYPIGKVYSVGLEVNF
jgi:TonB-linked SusC/RagA family outer membrane protein